MLKRFGIILLVIFGFFSITTTAWGLDFTEGKWEITSKVEMPGMPTAMAPITVTQCLTKQDPVPSKSAGGEHCRVIDMKQSGNTITWTMECDQQGNTMKSTGKMTYAGDKFEGTIQTNMGPQAGNMEITTKMSGKRIGACD